MPKSKTKITGIMIGQEYKDFRLYEVDYYERYQNTDETYSSTVISGSSWVKGLSDILQFFSLSQNENIEPANNRFIIVYDITNPNKEQYLNTILIGINKIRKNAQLPILLSIGHEQTPLSDSIRGFTSAVKEISDSEDRDQLLKNIVNKEQSEVIKENKLSLILEQKKQAFNNQLIIISNKAQQLRDNGHIAAANKADELYKKLTQKSEQYFNNPSEKTYISFKDEAKNEIKKTHEELDKHRGWKRALGNIALAILGFGVLYLAAVLVNRNVFFNKTDSSEKLDNLEELIENNVYQIN